MSTIFDVSIKEKRVYGSLCLSYFLSIIHVLPITAILITGNNI